MSDMRNFNPYKQTWTNAESRELYRRDDLSPLEMRKRRGRKYMQATHLFEQTFSDTATFKTETMTGKEAWDLNLKLLDCYIRSIDRGTKGARLERWDIVKEAA